MDKKQDRHIIIGKRIKEERKRLNLTQEEVAEKVGMDYKYLSAIERGASKPSLDIFLRIADALKVSYNDLLQESKKKTEDEEMLIQIKYLFSGLSKEKKKKFISAIQEFKKLIK